MNDIQIKDGIKVTQGMVSFPAYETLKAQATQVAEIIRNTEVTEDTIKDAKKALAAANNAVKELEARRIAIKKELLIPYDEFETQVKEIVTIVKDADAEVRAQVRHLEEDERDRKEGEIRNLWDLRFRPYENTLSFLTFEDFLTPQHLNKTETMKKVEASMTDWLEARRRDVEVIKEMPDSIGILTEYRSCLDLTLAVSTVQSRNKVAEQIQKVMPTPTKTTVTVFIIQDEKDAKIAELMLKQNNIAYIKEIK